MSSSEEVVFINYNEPPGATWDRIAAECTNRNVSARFIISGANYRGHSNVRQYLTIVKCPGFIPKRIYFVLHTLYLIISSRGSRFIFLTQPPFAFYVWGIFSKLVGVQYGLYCMDLYPDIFLRKPHMSNRVLNKIIHYCISPAYRYANFIIVIGRDMKDLIHKHYGVPQEKILYQRNWSR